MNGGIGRIGKLLGHKEVVLIRQLSRLVDRALHAFGARCQYKIGTKRSQHHATFHRHRVRHRQREFVSSRGTDEGEGDPRVPAGWLDDFHARLQSSAFFRVPDHGRTDAAFHAVGRISAFNLGEDGGVGSFRQPVDSYQRRTTN